jgi:serine/threonine protein kinase
MSGGEVLTESVEPQGSVATPSLAAGALVLDKYRVVKPIGRGGMGEVYEATHATLGSRVALKLPLGRRPSPAGAARMLREAQVAASLDPERVARVLDVGVAADGRPVIVLELLQGETLADRLERGPAFRVTEAVDFAIGASLGLVEAHQRNIIHRDVKPSNIFLTRRRDGTTGVKVLDFGVAAIRSNTLPGTDDLQLTDSKATVGSPPYMAPEQIRSRPVDARTDVWGLGTLLFELLAGRRPFDGPTAAAVAAAIVADPVPDLRKLRPDVPVALAGVVGQCLAKSATQRPANALALARLLAPFASAASQAEVAAITTAAAEPHTVGLAVERSPSVVTQRATVTNAGPESAAPFDGVRIALALAALLAGALFVWAVAFRDAPTGSANILSSSEAETAMPIEPSASSAVTVDAPLPLAASASSPTAAVSTEPSVALRPMLPVRKPIGTSSGQTTAPSAIPTAPTLLDQRKF